MTFTEAQDAFFADFFRLYPVHATEAGNHQHDGEWPDLTDAGHAARLAVLETARADLEAPDAASLTPGQAIDRDVLLTQIDALRFDEQELRELSWNAIAYVYLFGTGLFGLLSREFAPLPERLASVARRMRGLPAALDAARANLDAAGERAVSRFHVEKAIATMPGVGDLCRSAVTEADREGGALREEVADAADVGATAVDQFTAWLRDELLPRADGDFRLGRDLYLRKFRHALKSTVDPDDLEARATSAYSEVRAEMLRIARELWSEWIGDEPVPADDNATIRRVLDAIAGDHPAAGELLHYCRAENEKIEAFIRERDLIGLPDEPLQIIWTPPFLRAFGGAMLIPPGPLDRGLSSYFAITPMPDDWTDEQRESNLREDNRRMLRLLTIHEAVPGHYLQLAYSNRCPSRARGVFASGVFAEGWAVYVTQMMMDIGYGADDRALMLVHWKFFLRAVTNTLIDFRIHAGSMTEEEAMGLMVEGGFQERSEASEKWNRARLSSTQLCEYYLGSVEMSELERLARAAADGAGREFAWRPFLESVLAYGTPPMPVIRKILYPG